MTAAVARAARVLEARAGFRFDAGARRRLERCLADRSAATGASVDRLVDQLERGVGVDDLVDALTVQESAFFRHPEQFAALRDLFAAAPGPLTVWSAASANGQEPYSLAMLLDELGRDDFRVVATDVSRPALARTAAGVYAERELTGLDAARRARHGTDGPDGWTVRAALRARVTVARHRLARDPLPVAPGSCQAILCRNVLIYLTASDAAHVLRHARPALAPDGRLLLGGAEALTHQVDGLAAGRFGPAFAYAAAAPRSAAPPAERPASAIAPAASGVTTLLHLGEAATAAGDHARAARAFREAVTLDPGRALAHVRLAFALEASGDAAGARRAFVEASTRVSAVSAAELDGHDPALLVALLRDKVAAAPGAREAA